MGRASMAVALPINNVTSSRCLASSISHLPSSYTRITCLFCMRGLMALAYFRSLSVPLASMIAMFMASKLISAIVSPAMIAAKRTRKTHNMMYIQNAGEQPARNEHQSEISQPTTLTFNMLRFASWYRRIHGIRIEVVEKGVLIDSDLHLVDELKDFVLHNM
eukprot:749993-Hanusia_phi.AAC.1